MRGAVARFVPRPTVETVNVLGTRVPDANPRARASAARLTFTRQNSGGGVSGQGDWFAARLSWDSNQLHPPASGTDGVYEMQCPAQPCRHSRRPCLAGGQERVGRDKRTETFAVSYGGYLARTPGLQSRRGL